MDEGLLFPWPVLNQIIRIDAGGLTVIGAATSHGKSTFILNLIDYWLERYDGAIILWSGEMAAPILWARLVGIKSGISFAEVLKCYRGQQFSLGINKARERLNDLAGNLYIIDVPLTAKQFKVYCARIRQEQKITAIIVDYLQQMLPNGNRYRTREEEVSQTAQELRLLAQELKVPVIASSQLSRQNSMYSEKPQLAHFRESGRIEQEAQLAIGLWNSRMARVEGSGVPRISEEKWYWAGDDQSTANAISLVQMQGHDMIELDVLKSRLRGNVGKAVPLMLDGSSGKITDLPDVVPVSISSDIKTIRRRRRGA